MGNVGNLYVFKIFCIANRRVSHPGFMQNVKFLDCCVFVWSDDDFLFSAINKLHCHCFEKRPLRLFFRDFKIYGCLVLNFSLHFRGKGHFIFNQFSLVRQCKGISCITFLFNVVIRYKIQGSMSSDCPDMPAARALIGDFSFQGIVMGSRMVPIS